MHNTKNNDELVLLPKLKALFADTRNDRHKLIDSFLSLCEPDDLVYLCHRVDEYKRDFVCLLPLEVVELVLGYLDWQSLFSCLRVNKSWHARLANDFNRTWFKCCTKQLPIREQQHNLEYSEQTDYRRAFVELKKQCERLESGRLFKMWQVWPTDINALAIFQDTIATATHVVKFWKIDTNTEDNNNSHKQEWKCVKSFQLLSRASSLKFDARYLIATTYFLTIDMYAMSTGQCLFQYMGHTCSVSCFDFSAELMLIASGSADNTIKYWTMNVQRQQEGGGGEQFEGPSTRCLIGSQQDATWPVKICIEKRREDEYLVLALCVNGFLFVTSVQRVEDFSGRNTTFNFPHKLLFSHSMRHFLSVSHESNDNMEGDDNDEFSSNDETTSVSDYLISSKSRVTFDASEQTLTVYIITDNNFNKSLKFYIKAWTLKEEGELSFESKDTSRYDFDFLNTRSIEHLGIDQFEIVDFGKKYCLFIDEQNTFYIANLVSRRIESLQERFKLDTKNLRVFKLTPCNTQEQYVFGNRAWLDGITLFADDDKNKKTDEIVFTFYGQNRHEFFVVTWINT